ncbi:MAG: hypothetical protein HZB50_10005 [Chloroflexi bacterium]|nr:hypothetical protein [Chloroflexota bacterium]
MNKADETSRSSPGKFWRTFILLSVAVSIAAIYQTEQQTQALLKIRSKLKWVFIIGIFAANLGVGLYLLLRKDKNDSLWQSLEHPGAGIISKILGISFLVVAFPVLWYIKFNAFTYIDPPFMLLFWVWLWLTLVQAAGVKILTRTSWALSFALVVLFNGIIYQLYFFLQPVTDYPFSVGWSEASRFYYGSLPFSKSIYGVQLPLSVWHGSRYFLLSLSFLFNKSSLFGARLWQAVLWFSTNGLVVFLLLRRLKWNGLLTKLLLGGWFFLFLFQGAVYYHLLICVIIILAGVSPRHFWRSLIAVILASFWAGMSRVNWFPVPAMLAIMLYILEEPFSKNNDFWKYIQKPILWGVLGIVFAFAGQFFYIAISGNSDLSEFGSSFTSALLWYRWWPSDTNPLGVIPGVILISLPPLVLLTQILRGGWNSFHPLRWLGISAMLVILLVGGLIVSTKIGGGGDLHNLDAYIVLLGVLTMYFMNGRVEAESTPLPPLKLDLPYVMGLFLIIPVALSFSRVVPPVQYNHQKAADDLQKLRMTVQAYSQKGEVLFINERHLLTFDLIPGVPIVSEYEVVSLMEMAISGNQPYLDKFHQDLQSHRFAAIVARQQRLRVQAGDFAEEAIAWNQQVGYQLLCEYEPILTLTSADIQVLIPREKTKCP